MQANRAFLREAAGALDFSQPVGVMMLAVMHFIPASDNPPGIVSRLMARCRRAAT